MIEAEATSIWLDPDFRAGTKTVVSSLCSIFLGYVLFFHADDASDILLGRGTFRGLSVSSTPGWMVKPFGIIFLVAGLFILGSFIIELTD